MRVIAGTARSLRLGLPEGDEVRPTIDRYKETNFNILNRDVPGAVMIDVFAGSGANGIEALSRGAKEAYFIENNSNAIYAIEKNLEFTKLIEKATIMKYDYTNALTMLKDRGVVADIIYIDPPFNQDYERDAIEQILALGLLDPDGVLVCESDAKTDLSFIDDMDNIEIVKEKAYNTCKFTFIRFS